MRARCSQKSVPHRRVDHRASIIECLVHSNDEFTARRQHRGASGHCACIDCASIEDTRSGR
jgi:hypothetical protein